MTLKLISDEEALALLKTADSTSPVEYASAIDLASATSKYERARTLAEVRARLEAGEHLDDVLAE